MCGIVGYVGSRPAAPILIDGLRRLAYRGYDSAGLAVMNQGRISVRRVAGKVEALADLVEKSPAGGSAGLGHTRWATHGRPNTRNAHPHTDCSRSLVVAHNGIVENFGSLRGQLLAEGHLIRSDTDSEVIAHLVERFVAQGCDLEAAVCRALPLLRGTHGIAVMSTYEPSRLVVARIGNAGGVVVGLGDGEMFASSDLAALLDHTRQVIYLESGQMAVLDPHGVHCRHVDGEALQPTVHQVAWKADAAAKGPYAHFMRKEIAEQPQAITANLRGRVDLERGAIQMPELEAAMPRLRKVKRLHIVACGTSAHAGMVAKYLIERLARLPVEVDYGSEFRYREPLIDAEMGLLAITQSGETADTLAAIELGRQAGACLLAIVNATGTQAERMAEATIHMNAGPEIGVASTKAFTASLVDLYCLAVVMGQERGVLSQREVADLVQELAELPRLAADVLADQQPYQVLARRYQSCHDFLYLGRGIQYPIALEGALKLKEISYVHAEGYPAGEMKHGPIALVALDVPTVAIALRDALYPKMRSQIEQVKARGGPVIALATEGDVEIAEIADHVLWLPPVSPWLAPILTVLPLQCLAYHMAVRRGCDVDQPRNLAKSVTVE